MHTFGGGGLESLAKYSQGLMAAAAADNLPARLSEGLSSGPGSAASVRSAST